MILVALLTLGACGSGDDPAASASPSPSAAASDSASRAATWNGSAANASVPVSSTVEVSGRKS